MNKKIILGIVVLMVLILVGIGIYRKVYKENEGKTVKIGAVLPLTGKFSFYGNEVKNALEIVQQTDSLIQFVYEDNLSQANLSVTVRE